MGGDNASLMARRMFKSLLTSFTGVVCWVSSVSGLAAVEPWQLILLGDTQKYQRVITEGGPDLFHSQTEWIRDNMVRNNIKFMTHLGDVTNDNTMAEWDLADRAMQKIDGLIPYSVTLGNHDGNSLRSFGRDRYTGYPWYLGSSPLNLCHAQTFEAGGITFLHINLRHRPTASQRAWAQTIIDAHPGKPTMISTHGYMADNGSGRDSDGRNIWNDLVEPNEQVIMTFCGHDWVPRHELDTTSSGRKVMQIMTNYQQTINGGNAWLQYLTFDPDNSEVHLQTYSPYLDRYQTDFSSDFKFSATFDTVANKITIHEEIGPKRNFWNGGGSNGDWMTAANWGGTAPLAGQFLEFKGTSRKVSNNNFPAGTNFPGIIFSPGNFSNGYQFDGNAITLTGDIVNMGGYGPNGQPQAGPRINLPLTLVGDRQINTGDWDMTINGVISGSGSLTKTHGRDYLRGSMDGGVYRGDLFLTNVNTYTGETSLTGGALILSNSAESNLMPASPSIELYLNTVLEVSGLQAGTLTLAADQTIKGTGKIVGNSIIPEFAAISPGHANRLGRLNLMGNLTMQAGAALNLRFGGSETGQYDQLHVTGATYLGGASLNLAAHGAFIPRVGDIFTIVRNESGAGVNSVFVSGNGSHLVPGTPLPEGAIVSTDFVGSGYAARISYSGGTGNDVTLEVLAPPGPPIFIANPIVTHNAEVDFHYRATISGTAVDGDDDPLVYSKLAGPNWLSISPGGTLFGKPDPTHIGINTFSVEVSDPNGGTDTTTLIVEVSPKRLVGQWDFNDPSDLTKATIGQDLTKIGTDEAVAGVHAGDGAARIGVGSYYRATHGISPQPGDEFVNGYTLMFDVSYPLSSRRKWMALFQTAPNNHNDAELFIRANDGTIGISTTGYSSWVLNEETWARIVISVDNGNHYKIYADGNLILTGNVQPKDGVYSLNPTLLFFADDNGEDHPIDVSAIRLYNAPLNDSEVAALGDALTTNPDQNNNGIPDSWEIANSLRTDIDESGEDPDGDGFTNWQEYLADTDPHDPQSGAKLSVSPSTNPSEISVSFMTSAKRYYTVEYSEDLGLTDPWKPLNFPFPGTGALAEIIEPIDGPRRFYRLKIELQ